MTKYAMLISYDGSKYGGWQIQPNSCSIQGLVEDALATILKEHTNILGSSRTDAGVHSLGQVAHFETNKPIALYKVQHSLNGMLPKEVRILELYPVQEEFHARYSATGKTYHYHLHLDRVSDPFTHLYSWHIPYKIDLSLLEKATSLFIGTKDFSAFANEAHKGAASKNGVRNIKRIDIIKEAHGVRLEFEGSGFLYKMVRNITGTLIDVARGRIRKEEVETIFASKDRKKAGIAAPAQGLFLMKVDYDDKSSLKEEN
jgi:tRNA pseudouridine38-40 synthase